MNEYHMCNYCKNGVIKYFQFSFNQAIIKCSNPECDSYLDKYPWECAVTRPIVKNIPSFVDDKDFGVCSSSTSGVHSSNSGSSLVSPAASQVSLTDREVELLLRQSYAPASLSSALSQVNKLAVKEKTSLNVGGVDGKVKRNESWILPSGGSPQANPQGIKFEDGDERSRDSFSPTFPDFELDVASSLEEKNNNLKRERDIYDLLKDIDIGLFPSPIKRVCPVASPRKSSEFSNRELEKRLRDYDNSPSKVITQSTTPPSFLSPTNSFIPSVKSAFSVVSPRKQFIEPLNFDCPSTSKIMSERDLAIPKFTNLARDRSHFLSPTSSGISDDSGFNEDDPSRSGLQHKNFKVPEAESQRMGMSPGHSSQNKMNFPKPKLKLEERKSISPHSRIVKLESLLDEETFLTVDKPLCNIVPDFADSSVNIGVFNESILTENLSTEGTLETNVNINSTNLSSEKEPVSTVQSSDNGLNIAVTKSSQEGMGCNIVRESSDKTIDDSSKSLDNVSIEYVFNPKLLSDIQENLKTLENCKSQTSTSTVADTFLSRAVIDEPESSMTDTYSGETSNISSHLESSLGCLDPHQKSSNIDKDSFLRLSNQDPIKSRGSCQSMMSNYEKIINESVFDIPISIKVVSCDGKLSSSNVAGSEQSITGNSNIESPSLSLSSSLKENNTKEKSSFSDTGRHTEDSPNHCSENSPAHCSEVENSPVHCSDVENSPAQCSDIANSPVHCSVIDNSPAHCSDVEDSPADFSDTENSAHCSDVEDSPSHCSDVADSPTHCSDGDSPTHCSDDENSVHCSDDENSIHCSDVDDSPAHYSDVEDSPTHCSGVEDSPAHCSDVENSPAHCSDVEDSPAHCSDVENSPAHCSDVDDLPIHCSDGENSVHCSDVDSSVAKTSPRPWTIGSMEDVLSVFTDSKYNPTEYPDVADNSLPSSCADGGKFPLQVSAQCSGNVESSQIQCSSDIENNISHCSGNVKSTRPECSSDVENNLTQWSVNVENIKPQCSSDVENNLKHWSINVENSKGQCSSDVDSIFPQSFADKFSSAQCSANLKNSVDIETAPTECSVDITSNSTVENIDDNSEGGFSKTYTVEAIGISSNITIPSSSDDLESTKISTCDIEVPSEISISNTSQNVINVDQNISEGPCLMKDISSKDQFSSADSEDSMSQCLTQVIDSNVSLGEPFTETQVTDSKITSLGESVTETEATDSKIPSLGETFTETHQNIISRSISHLPFSVKFLEPVQELTECVRRASPHTLLKSPEPKRTLTCTPEPSNAAGSPSKRSMVIGHKSHYRILGEPGKDPWSIEEYFIDSLDIEVVLSSKKRDSVDPCTPPIDKNTIKEIQSDETTKNEIEGDKDTEKESETSKCMESEIQSEKNTQKEIQSDNNLENEIQSDNNLEREIQSDNNLEKEIQSDNNLEKEIQSDNNTEKEIQSVQITEKEIQSLKNTENEIKNVWNIEKEIQSVQNTEKDIQSDHKPQSINIQTKSKETCRISSSETLLGEKEDHIPQNEDLMVEIDCQIPQNEELKIETQVIDKFEFKRHVGESSKYMDNIPSAEVDFSRMDTVVNETSIEAPLLTKETVSESCLSVFDIDPLSEKPLSDNETVSEKTLSDNEVVSEKSLSDNEVVSEQLIPVSDKGTLTGKLISDKEMVPERSITSSDNEALLESSSSIFDVEPLSEKHLSDNEVIPERSIPVSDKEALFEKPPSTFDHESLSGKSIPDNKVLSEKSIAVSDNKTQSKRTETFIDNEAVPERSSNETLSEWFPSCISDDSLSEASLSHNEITEDYAIPYVENIKTSETSINFLLNDTPSLNSSDRPVTEVLTEEFTLVSHIDVLSVKSPLILDKIQSEKLISFLDSNSPFPEEPIKTFKDSELLSGKSPLLDEFVSENPISFPDNKPMSGNASPPPEEASKTSTDSEVVPRQSPLLGEALTGKFLHLPDNKLISGKPSPYPEEGNKTSRQQTPIDCDYLSITSEEPFDIGLEALQSPLNTDITEQMSPYTIVYGEIQGPSQGKNTEINMFQPVPLQSPLNTDITKQTSPYTVTFGENQEASQSKSIEMNIFQPIPLNLEDDLSNEFCTDMSTYPAAMRGNPRMSVGYIQHSNLNKPNPETNRLSNVGTADYTPSSYYSELVDSVNFDDSFFQNRIIDEDFDSLLEVSCRSEAGRYEDDIQVFENDDKNIQKENYYGDDTMFPKRPASIRSYSRSKKSHKKGRHSVDITLDGCIDRPTSSTSTDRSANSSCCGILENTIPHSPTCLSPSLVQQRASPFQTLEQAAFTKSPMKTYSELFSEGVTSPPLVTNTGINHTKLLKSPTTTSPLQGLNTWFSGATSSELGQLVERKKQHLVLVSGVVEGALSLKPSKSRHVLREDKIFTKVSPNFGNLEGDIEPFNRQNSEESCSDEDGSLLHRSSSNESGFLGEAGCSSSTKGVKDASDSTKGSKNLRSDTDIVPDSSNANSKPVYKGGTLKLYPGRRTIDEVSDVRFDKASKRIKADSTASRSITEGKAKNSTNLNVLDRNNSTTTDDTKTSRRKSVELKYLTPSKSLSKVFDGPKSPLKSMCSSIAGASTALNDNTSSSDILKLLRYSGWIVTPCDPSINYSSSLDRRSTTYVPQVLRKTYGSPGSDILSWNYSSTEEVDITDIKKAEALPSKIDQNISNSSDTKPKNKLGVYKNSKFDKLRNKSYQKWQNQSRIGMFQYPPLKITPRSTTPTIKIGGDKYYLQPSVGMKRALENKEKDSSPVCKKPRIEIKQEKETVESSADSSPLSVSPSYLDSDDDDDIVDDFRAYEELRKSGMDVEKPQSFLHPSIPHVFQKKLPDIKKELVTEQPTISKEKIKKEKKERVAKSRKKVFKNIKSTYKPQTKEKELPKEEPEDPVKNKLDLLKKKAERTLSKIVSEEKVKNSNDVPQVVCMTFGDQVYVYCRKD